MKVQTQPKTFLYNTSVQLKLCEVPVAGFLAGDRFLLFLEQDVSSENQYIHVGHREAAEGIFGRADNWFTAHVEAGVDQNRTFGFLIKPIEQLMH